MNIVQIGWDDGRSVEEIVTSAGSADYLRIRPHKTGSADNSPIPTDVTASMILFRDESQTELRLLSPVLPPELYLLAASPQAHVGVAIRVGAAREANLAHGCESLAEFVVKLAALTNVSFVDDCPVDETVILPRPALSIADGTPGPDWVRRRIAQLTSRSSTVAIPLAALKAGLYLLNDYFDESHESSQAIEGMGRLHLGDYWHAILHRREPDYGNAKYWFRHVGKHPVFNELAATARVQLNTNDPTLSGRLQPWKSRLVTSSGWDPMAFVDICSAAENDPVLKSWCEEIQYSEMVLLLEMTAKEARESHLFDQ